MKRALPSMRSVAFLLLGVFLFLLLLIHSEIAMDGVRQGWSLCTETLFPSLFPFLVLSELLVASGAGESLGRLLSRPVSALFGISSGGAVALLLGWLCGFPVGTTTAVSLYQKREISKSELERVVLFANNPSSGFLISAVGEALFGNRGAGVTLFLITLLSSALVGIGLHLLFGKAAQNQNNTLNGVEKGLSASDFTGSIKRGFSALLQVSAFVLFFSCISKCLIPILEHIALPKPVGVLLCGVLEMTSGISTAVTELSPGLAFRATAFFASFAGLSVCLQIFSVAEAQRLRLLPYLAARTVQGALALLLSELYLGICKPDFVTAESVDTIAPIRAESFPFPFALAAFFLLLIVIHCTRKKACHKASRL